MMLTLLGIYLLIDSGASLIKFRKQHWFYQAERVGRGIIGLCLIKRKEV